MSYVAVSTSPNALVPLAGLGARLRGLSGLGDLKDGQAFRYNVSQSWGRAPFGWHIVEPSPSGMALIAPDVPPPASPAPSGSYWKYVGSGGAGDPIRWEAVSTTTGAFVSAAPNAVVPVSAPAPAPVTPLTIPPEMLRELVNPTPSSPPSPARPPAGSSSTRPPMPTTPPKPGYYWVLVGNGSRMDPYEWRQEYAQGPIGPPPKPGSPVVELPSTVEPSPVAPASQPAAEPTSSGSIVLPVLGLVLLGWWMGRR